MFPTIFLLCVTKTKIFKIRSQPILPEFAKLGFTSKPLDYKSFGKFTAKSGPRFPQQATTPLAAIRCFVTDEVLAKFVANAKAADVPNASVEEKTTSWFWRYFSVTLGHGIVSHKQERDAFASKSSSLHGLLGNEFFQFHHSREQWKRAKKIWWLSRDELTAIFNDRSAELWIPCQLIHLSENLSDFLKTDSLSLFCLRKQAVDEGGMQLFANIEDRSYIPGKPHPNCAEYIIAVGEDGYALCMVWRKDIGGKYSFPEKKIDQMKVFINYFKNLRHSGIQPYIFYIDARWSSLLLMEALQEAQFYGVLSCSSSMKPGKLLKWMRTDLGVKDWWSIGYTPLRANLITIRTKKKVYLNILTNWASLKAEEVWYKKRKFPAGEYSIKAPAVQKEYNIYKAKVDQWNKNLLQYYRFGRFTGKESFYMRFFVHAFTLQAYTLYCASTGSSIPQLEFRKRLINELHTVIFGPAPAAPLSSSVAHWPVDQKPAKKKCQVDHCGSSAYFYCPGCDIWGTYPCLSKKHGY